MAASNWRDKLAAIAGGTANNAATNPKPPTSSGSGSSQPKQPIAYTGTQPKPVPVPQPDARASRIAQMNAFTGWDNDPAVQSLQRASWAIYIDTGRWDTAEQKQLAEQAQKARQYNNPMYDPSKQPYGPLDWMDAEKVTPRGTTPGSDSIEGAIDGILDPSKFGSYMKMGVGVVFLFMIVSMFRR